LSFPLIVKPNDSAGSRGVSVVKDKSALFEAFNSARRQSRIGEVILEGFIEGKECTVEGLTYDGRTEILAISEKKKIEGEYRVATDIVYPSAFSDGIIKDIKRTVKRAVKAIGIDMGPTHSELIVTPEGKPVLLEVAARGGGFGIFSTIVPLISGVDIVKETIKICLGEKPDMKRIWSALGKLERDKREGVVIKSKDGKKGMKYTVSGANQGEVGFAFSYPFDHGIEFWFRRLVREAFQSYEMKEGEKELEERGRRLGMAILGPMRESIEKVAAGEKLTQDCLVEGEAKVLNGFLAHLKRLGVKFEAEWVGENEVKIKRIHQRSQDKIKNYLGGEFASD